MLPKVITTERGTSVLTQDKKENQQILMTNVWYDKKTDKLNHEHHRGMLSVSKAMH